MMKRAVIFLAMVLAVGLRAQQGGPTFRVNGNSI